MLPAKLMLICTCVCTHVHAFEVKWSESCSVVSDSLWPHGLYSPWNSPGQNTGVGNFPFSRGSSQPRDWTQVSSVAGRFFTIWPNREAHFLSDNIQMFTELYKDGILGGQILKAMRMYLFHLNLAIKHLHCIICFNIQTLRKIYWSLFCTKITN